MSPTLRKILVPTIAVIIFLILWEALVWAMGWPNYKMASPSDLMPAYSRYWELFLVMGWQTLWRTILGLLLAIAVGIALGMVMGFSRTMRDALYPILVGFNAVPKATVETATIAPPQSMVNASPTESARAPAASPPKGKSPKNSAV